MPFVRKPGFKGKIYIPEKTSCNKKKHECPDCFSCLNCSDERCGLCIGKKNCNTIKNKRDE